MAKTFKFGENGKWATKTGSSLAYNDQNDNFKPMPFSVTRDGIATRVNKEGLIEVVGNDKLRIDYTDSSKGVALLEPARTNLVQYSEDFSNAYWSKGGSSITSNSIISPDGTLNGDKLTVDFSNSTHFIDTSSISFTSGVSYTVSVFVKDNNKNLVIQGSGTVTANAFASFDLKDGFIIDESVGTATIKSFGNSWYRCSLTFTAAATTSGVITFLMGETRNDTYTGDGTSGLYLWGAQLEQGSYATSYIPTSGATSQRQYDVARGAGNSEVFNDSEGVLFANIAAIDDAETNNRRLGLTKNGTYEGLRIQYNGSTIGAVLYDGSTNQYTQAFTFSKLSLFAKVAFKYKASDFALWINGFEYGAQASGTTLPNGTLDDLSFDYVNGNFFFAKTKEIGVYDAVLTDAELEALTSYTSFTNMANELNLTIK